MNNVSLENLQKTIEDFKKEPFKARKTNRVEGVWNLKEGEYQFSACLKFDKGEMELKADQPIAQGGGGNYPGPMLYCLYGLASCYVATFVTIASIQEVKLHSIRVVAESDVNFAPVFGLQEAPIIEQVRLKLYVKSHAKKEKIQELEALATQRCPGVYCMKNPIPFKTELNYEG